MDRTIIYPTAELAARGAGFRLLLALIERQAIAVPIHIALTGGTMGIRMLTEIVGEPLAAAIDWNQVHLWWGDERFAVDADRNASQAQPWIASLPIPIENVHEVARPSEIPTVAEAAQAYAAAVRDVHFAIVILGIGPEGHVASLFPDRDEIEDSSAAALPVTDSPKPPPERVTISRQKLQDTDELWFIAAGAEKHAAVRASLAGGDDPSKLPAARVRGRSTLWLLDAAAAGIKVDQ